MLKRLLHKKALLCVVVTLALLTAVGINYAVGVNGPKVKELSLNDAIDLALKNNPDVELANLAVKKAQIEYDSAKEVANRIDVDSVLRGVLPNSTLPDKTMPIELQYKYGLELWVNPVATDVKLAVAKKNKELSENNLRYSVENAYYTILKSERNLAIKRENLKYFQDQLKIAQTGYKIGTKAKVDVTIAEAGVAAYQALVTGEENKYRGAVMELNRMTGLPLDTPLKLTTQFSVEKMSGKVNLDATLKNALQNNVTIYSLKRNLEVIKATADVNKKFYGGSPTADTSDIDTKSAEATVRKTELALNSAIKQSYLSLFSLETTIDWQTKEVEKAKENAKVFAIKYQAGLATSLDVKKATIDLEQSEESLAESIFQYNLLKAQFKYDLFLSGAGSGSQASSGTSAQGGAGQQG